ncbi:MAG: type I restriction-modification system subunit M N-terminal domain-containing protein, partial [Akkermansiaceae bacterium]
MPAKKKSARKAAKKPAKSFEETLWDTANKLRGSVESSDWSGATKTTRPGCPEGERGGANQYKHVVLSLIFLKFVSDKFEERRAELVAEGKEEYLDMVDWSGATETTRQGCPEGERGGANQFYTMQNVFYLPETSRWSYIQQHAKQGDIAIKIDSALTAVEKSNASLKGALPDNYFSRLGLDGSKLSALIDAINNIDTVEDKEEDTVGRVYEPSGARQTTRQGSPQGERGGANQYFLNCGGSLPASRPCGVRFAETERAPALGIVQSIKFVESHHGSKRDISVYGQDQWERGDHLRQAKRARRVRPPRKRPNQFTATTYKLAKMNLAVRGLSANLGEVPADTFF